MIHVDRSKIPLPPFWHEPEFRSFLQEWAFFHGVEGGSRRTQRRVPAGEHGLQHYLDLALPHLLEAFHGKCAYTEERIDRKTGTVVLHRPPSDALGLTSDVAPEHSGGWSPTGPTGSPYTAR